MSDKQLTYQSYANEYTKKQLAQTVLRKQSVNRQPACPLCNSKLYVKTLTVGLVTLTDYEGTDEDMDERGAPLTCIYEGFDWDCARCLIKFT